MFSKYEHLYQVVKNPCHLKFTPLICFKLVIAVGLIQEILVVDVKICNRVLSVKLFTIPSSCLFCL